MKKILAVLFLMTQALITAQDYKFGKVSKEELEETFYSLDSTADATYLFKKRRTYYNFVVNDGFKLVTEYHERIKIYTKDGFEMATKSIPYYAPEYGGKESVFSIKGYTFNLEDGKVKKEKLATNSIFRETISKYRSVKKITMPKIKEGCIIELRYKIMSPYIQSIADLKFQYQIPVKKLNYQVEIPEYFVFNKKNTGYQYLEMRTEYKNGRIGETDYKINVFKFNEKNIPALKNDEPFVSSIKNYRAGMKFEIAERNFISIGGDFKSFSNSWASVSKQIYKASSFGGELNKSSYYKEDLQKILETNKSEAEKLVAIFQFVKGKVKWNEYYGIYSDKGVKKAYKERSGNVADINLMLTSMLRAAGLNADPVLVSTRTNGVPIFPTLNGFNYVISSVELSAGNVVLLDATEPYCAPNILPARDLNWNGRRITKEGNSSWIKLTSSKLALEENNITASISDDMIVNGISRTKFGNLSALTYRKNHNHLTEETTITNLEEEDKIEIEGFRLSNEKLIGKPVTRLLQFSSEDLVENINGKLYLEPLLFLSQHKNPFKLKDRKFPVDFITPWKDKNAVSIEIPEGYKVESVPDNLAIDLPENLGIFRYQIIQKENRIGTISILQFNNAIITPKYYAALKDFYRQLVEKQSEKIVLVKI
jgi:hypothetical protein